jgi:hypothetical protein
LSDIRSLLGDELDSGVIDLGGFIRITGEDQLSIEDVPFDDAVRIRRSEIGHDE